LNMMLQVLWHFFPLDIHLPVHSTWHCTRWCIISNNKPLTEFVQFATFRQFFRSSVGVVSSNMLMQESNNFIRRWLNHFDWLRSQIEQEKHPQRIQQWHQCASL
jgi:hypothetical protein